jgi:hypothetical protein
MGPLRDEDLISDPVIRQAVEARRAAGPAPSQPHHWPIGWLISAVAIGVVVILLIGLLHPAG